MRRPFRFLFKNIPITDVEPVLHLAIFAVEGLFGRSRVRRDMRYHIDKLGRVIVVDAGNEVGEALVGVFANLLLREFGDDSVQVVRSETVDSLENYRTEMQYKKRTCLRCCRLFESTGPENRICRTCRRINNRLEISEAEFQTQRGVKRRNGEPLR